MTDNLFRQLLATQRNNKKAPCCLNRHVSTANAKLMSIVHFLLGSDGSSDLSTDMRLQEQFEDNPMHRALFHLVTRFELGYRQTETTILLPHVAKSEQTPLVCFL